MGHIINDCQETRFRSRYPGPPKVNLEAEKSASNQTATDEQGASSTTTAEQGASSTTTAEPDDSSAATAEQGASSAATKPAWDDRAPEGAAAW